MPNWSSPYGRGFGRRKPGLWARADDSHTLTRGLVGCWPASEGGGTALHDLGPFGNNGAASGTGVGWGRGPFGAPCLDFTGTGVMSCGNNASVQLTGDMTVAAWANTTTVTGTQVIMSKGAQGGSAEGYCLYLAGANLFWEQGDGTGLVQAGANSTLAANTWYFFVGTIAGTTTTAYIGTYPGGAVTAETTTGSFTGTRQNPASNLEIGNDPGGDPWSGLIDSVLLYNRALSVTELTWLYQRPFDFLTQPGPRRTLPSVSAFPGGDDEGLTFSWRTNW